MNREPTNRLAELVLGRPTLTEIAREAGVSVSFVSHIAAGRKKPTHGVRQAAAKVLGMPVHEIFGEQES